MKFSLTIFYHCYLCRIKADAMATVNDVGDATKAILNAELEPVADGDEN